MANATWSRVLHFRAGPEHHRFYACDEHKDQLVTGTMSDLFFGLAFDTVQPEDPDDDNECYACRGEDGP